MTEAICYRLPKDVSIDFSGAMNKPPQIYIRMTLRTAGHCQALRETCDILERLLEIASAPAPQPQTPPSSEHETAQQGEVQSEPQNEGGTDGERPVEEEYPLGPRS